MSKNPKRMSLADAKWLADYVSEILTTYRVPNEVCGSIRRGVVKDVGDIDIAVRDMLKAVYVIERVLEIKFSFPAKSKFDVPKHLSVQIGRIKLELYQADASNWGAMLLHLTGSGLFNIKMRVFAKAHGFKINQYGLWKPSEDIAGVWRLVAAKTEQQIFKALGLKFIKPENREDNCQSMWNFKIGG